MGEKVKCTGSTKEDCAACLHDKPHEKNFACTLTGCFDGEKRKWIAVACKPVKKKVDTSTET